jgi:hypothetical protein
MTEKTIGSFAEHAYSRDEWDALCRLHNEFNEYKVELIEDETGNLSLRLYRPE